jgi:hypothetical protein
MIRYIVQFYIPLSIIAAIGLEQFTLIFTKKNVIKYFSLFLLVFYLFKIVLSSAPYHLSYFNELVGGTGNVYSKKLFFIGWFGEGLKGPGIYVAKKAKKNMKIGLALNLHTGLYTDSKLKYEDYKNGNHYDYIILNYYNVVRSNFDPKVLNKDYKLVYTENIENGAIAWVYKHK